LRELPSYSDLSFGAVGRYEIKLQLAAATGVLTMLDEDVLEAMYAPEAEVFDNTRTQCLKMLDMRRYRHGTT
jgi:hypothetical protein